MLPAEADGEARYDWRELRGEQRERTAVIESSLRALEPRVRKQRVLTSRLLGATTDNRELARSLRAECSVLRQDVQSSRAALGESVLMYLAVVRRDLPQSPLAIGRNR